MGRSSQFFEHVGGLGRWRWSFRVCAIWDRFGIMLVASDTGRLSSLRAGAFWDGVWKRFDGLGGGGGVVNVRILWNHFGGLVCWRVELLGLVVSRPPGLNHLPPLLQDGLPFLPTLPSPFPLEGGSASSWTGSPASPSWRDQNPRWFEVFVFSVFTDAGDDSASDTTKRRQNN